MGTRADGGEHLVRISGGEDEAQVRRRLLDQFEQRVEALRRDHVGLVDDVDLVARLGRGEHRALAQVTGVVDAAVTCRIEFDHVDGAAALSGEVDAALAYATGIGRRALLAVEGAGHDARRGGLAAATGTGEEVCVVHAVVREGSAQRAGHVVLPDDLVQNGGSVGAVQGHGHVRHPNGDRRHAGTPRAPASARLPLLPSGPGGVRRDDTARGVDRNCTCPTHDESLTVVSVASSTEDSPSGLWRSLGKRVGVTPSGVRIPYPPR